MSTLIFVCKREVCANMLVHAFRFDNFPNFESLIEFPLFY